MTATFPAGTRERVAVLLRLAYADVLLECGRPAMLILDDALAHFDLDRRELMFRLLTISASSIQSLDLSCHADSIQRLGGIKGALPALGLRLAICQAAGVP